LIISRCANNCWKYNKVFYNSCIQFLVRFQPHYHQNHVFWQRLAVKQNLTSVTKVSVDDLLIDSETTIIRDVSAVCGDDPCTSVNTASKCICLFPLGGPSCPLGPSSGMILCCSFSVTPLCQILSWWVHPCLLVGWNTSPHGRNHCSLIKLLHDLLAPCNSCHLVVLENHLSVHFWLVDELPKLQSYLELCLFIQVLLQPGLQDGKHHFPLELAQESHYDTHPNRWCITRGTQPKGKMPCLEPRRYD
jgi:hypothetical protein